MAFWRNFIRKRMKPLDQDYARNMKKHLSALYFFVAWNLFGLTIYTWGKQSLPSRNEELESASKYYSRIYGLSEGTAYRYKGFELVEKFEILSHDKGKPYEETEDFKNHQKAISNENLELLVEESDSL